jgi:Na+-driven multidrug efflux pump
VVAIGAYNCVSSILRAVGDSKTPLYFLMVASVLNIVLDIWFVRDLHWGVAGVGIATIISQATSAIGAVTFAFVKNPYFKLEKAHFNIDWPIIQKSVGMGVPLAFHSSLIAISCVIVQSVVNTFGSSVVAAYTATERIQQVVQQPYNSLGMAMSTYAGQNIGAGNVDRVKQGGKKGCIIMAVFSLAMLPIAQFCGEPIMKLFVDEAEVIAYGVTALKITSCFYVFL